MIINNLYIPDELDDGTNMGDDIIKAIACKVDIPWCLTRRRLVFGDSEQIKALELIAREAQEIADDITEEYNGPDLRYDPLLGY